MEVLIAVVLVMLLTASAINLLANVIHNSNTSSLERDLSALRDNIVNAFTSRSNYSGLDEDLVQTLDIAPPSLKGFSGPGGASIRIFPDGIDERFFVIQFTSSPTDNSGILQATCAALIPGRGSNWDSFDVNGNTTDVDDFPGTLDACGSANSFSLRAQ